MIMNIRPLKLGPLIQLSLYKLSINNSQTISSCYLLFGLKPDCSNLDLKKSYLDMVRKYHPDLSKQPNAKQKFQQIQRAYDILQDHMKSKQPNKKSKQTKSQTQQTEESSYEDDAQKFYRKFGENFDRKSYSNQSMEFSYNLFKKHYENVGEKKKQYRKYNGKDRQQWYHKSEEQEQMPRWKFIRNCVGIIGCIGTTLYIGGVR